MKKFIRTIAVLGLAALPLTSMAQGAAAFPSRTIRVLCPFPPGAITDVLARMYANHLEKKYKQPAIVDNRTGAGQNIAGDATAKAAPDGYTILAASDALAWESLLNKDTPFNSQRDIVPFGIFAASGLFLATHIDLPTKTLAEFVAYVKANPGKVNVGLAGFPTVGFEEFRDRLGMNWTNVAYRGGAPAFQALLANDVQMYTTDVMQGVPAAQAGKIRMLAYSGGQRHPGAPTVPTFAESGVGVPGFDFKVWLGTFAPAGVPADILQKLNADVLEMQKTPDAVQRFNSMGWQAVPNGVDEVRRDSAASVQKVVALLAQGVKLR